MPSSYPQFIFCVSIFKGVVSVFGRAYPAGFGSLKAATNCFWPKKVGHINGLFVLENESGGYILRCRKIKQMEEWQAKYLAP